MTKTIPLAEVKKNFSAIIKNVDEKYDRFIVTKNGADKAIILSSDEFNGIIETLDILSNKEEKKALIIAKKQVEKGETISLKDFKTRLNLK